MKLTSSGRGRRQRTEKHTLFIDRSLGKSVASALDRFPWFRVVVMADVFQNDGQRVKDEQWLARAGAEGWIVLTQDARIWRREDERAAVLNHGVRVFCLGGQTYPVALRALLYGRYVFPMMRRAKHAAPCFWRLYPERVIKDLR